VVNYSGLARQAAGDGFTVSPSILKLYFKGRSNPPRGAANNSIMITDYSTDSVVLTSSFVHTG